MVAVCIRFGVWTFLTLAYKTILVVMTLMFSESSGCQTVSVMTFVYCSYVKRDSLSLSAKENEL